MSDPIFTAKSAPPTAPRAPPTADARSLYRTTLTPIASATCSSSRIAFQARPTRELVSLHEMNTAPAHAASAR